jgi:hypothetical protein
MSETVGLPSLKLSASAMVAKKVDYFIEIISSVGSIVQMFC